LLFSPSLNTLTFLLESVALVLGVALGWLFLVGVGRRGLAGRLRTGGTGGTLIAVLAVVVALVPRDCRPLLRRRTGVSASPTHLHQAQRQLSCIASELTSSSLSLHS
jgi:hypothetical protein